MDDVEVLIAGAGPTGLTLACDLLRRGIGCRVVDRAAEPSRGSRGFGVKPRTMEVFHDLGVADRVLAGGRTDSHLRFHLGHPPLFDLRTPAEPASARSAYPNSVSLPQWRTEAILRARLAELGGEVDFGCELTDFAADEDGVTATLRQDDGTAPATTETVRARYLVGADGGRSFVRHRLGLAFRGSTDEEARALLADARVRGLADDAVHLWLGDSGLLVLRPTPHADTWQVVASLHPDAAGEWPEATVETLRRAVVERTGRDDIELGEPEWLSVWRYNLRMVDQYRAGRVFLAGDAAHVHSPFGAFGMNTGIQDAYNLGWKLALVMRGRAEESLLDTYEAERLPVARAVLAESDRRFSAATPPAALRPLLRFLIKPFLARQQRQDREDRPRYRDSSLSLHLGSPRARVRAGDPAPGGVGRIPGESRPVLLLDLMRGKHFTLLAFGAGSAEAAERVVRGHEETLRVYAVTSTDRPASGGVRTIADTSGGIRRAYGARENSLVVIRPDGHIGLITHTEPERALREYLRRLGMRPARETLAAATSVASSPTDVAERGANSA
ncbi:FAD-dependent monooxygenase [Streptoalloteichus hindustanus]|uniref:2-polyprenyl-6-methoxyphenol hydroxylase n=1 Tax=Streptoalloteichus hindustanus TaxID=2017 RepID=A0A1M5EMD8_STRHI|nr:FAD-dependent monooxygenase [Streptoalloteichus hindustanus]SHF80314.1 2-polyprenyl-6-methoxyphenol hydroxylase [Streptoalloteichus hindustanus]